MPDLALVLFSGGQDSTTCLASALSRFARVETVGFTYGQRHIVEMDARPRILGALRDRFPEWREKLGDDHVLDLDVLKQIGGTALTDDVEIEIGERGLPNTFVPGRNILFLAAAAALGYRRGCRDLVGGMCETDYSGYPDCRDATIKACAQAISLGMDRAFTIHTPLMFLDKAATWKLAEDLGGKALVELIVEETVTCYLGDRTRRHVWGYGCGRCPACELRARGWRRYVGPLSPPWQRYPTYDNGSIDWRMGDGEDYWNTFWDWFATGLTESEQKEFLSKHAEPEGWEGIYEKMRDAFHRTGA